MQVALAITHHDPDGRLHDQLVRTLPAIRSRFDQIAISANLVGNPESLSAFEAAGAHIRHISPDKPLGLASVGKIRRDAVALGLMLDKPHIFFCDSDRVFHWLETYPDEFDAALAYLQDYDFTVFGRTQRAYMTHPRNLIETEVVANRVFEIVSGQPWDVLVACRGISRRAAESILNGCPEESISIDTAWPLHIQRRTDFSLSYLAMEGLEFETADRFPEEVEAAGGLEAWIGQQDSNPRQWAARLDISRIEIEGMYPYMQ